MKKVVFNKTKNYREANMKTAEAAWNSTRGMHFEKRVQNRLESNFYDCTIMHDVRVPSRKDNTTQIDFILLHETGIYVIEAKNYSGTVSGTKDDLLWKKTWVDDSGIPHIKMISNPIKQNEGHIKYIRKLVGDDIPMFSISILSEKCDARSIRVYGRNTYMFHLKESMRMIREIMDFSRVCLNEERIEELNLELSTSKL